MKTFLRKSGSFFSQGGITTLFVTVAIIVIIAVNAIFAALEDNYGWKKDLSHGSIYSLSSESEEILKDVDSKIKIYTLYSPGNENKAVETLLAGYRAENPNISVTNVDPSGARSELSKFSGASQLEVGSIVVSDEDGYRNKVLSPGDLYVTREGVSEFQAEPKLTSAIYYATTGDVHRIRLLYGHQETDVSKIADFINMFDTRNYEVSLYDHLRSTTTLDPAVDTLLAVSPKVDISEQESAAIDEFLGNGGMFILLLDKFAYDGALGTVKAMPIEDMPVLTALMKKWGMSIGDGMIVGADSGATSLRPSTLVIPENSGRTAVLSECAPIVISENSGAKPIVRTHDTCFLSPTASAGQNLGAFTVGALSKRGEGSFMLFSTSSFLENEEFGIADNKEMAASFLKMSASGEPIVNIEPKPIAAEEMKISSGVAKVFVTVVLLVFLPCGVLSAGVWVYIRRKRRA